MPKIILKIKRHKIRCQVVTVCYIGYIFFMKPFSVSFRETQGSVGLVGDACARGLIVGVSCLMSAATDCVSRNASVSVVRRGLLVACTSYFFQTSGPGC